ncbi:MAG TPA: nitrite/sulfite reductase [Candidatus Polarisedimenticolia bacterium]|nr:nitrite/sulfite reductase [Candidatus Polarisedimenticolia bacterium]
MATDEPAPTAAEDATSVDEEVRAPGRHFASQADIEEFVRTLESFERGEIGPDEFRTFRLTRGIYGQRQDDVQMIRVKIPQGILNPEQLRALAVVARDFSRGFGHVTTRQNLQFHFVKMTVVPQALAVMEKVGLTTREACGNTVRNVTACPMAGVCPTEPFDVTPYGEAVTRFFLRNPICQALPRKFKISLSGCPSDCSLGGIHDIGIIARTRQVDGRQEIGFKVVIGGGLSVSPQDAWVLHEFLPPERLLPVCEAVVRVFDRTGNRKNKGQARMKYAIRKLGWDAFKAEIEKEARGIPATRDPEVERYVEDERPARDGAPDDLHARVVSTGADPFRAWAATNARPQRQKGYSMAFVTLPRGDITAAQLDAIAALVERHGNGTLRTTQDQNLLLRWVRTEDLPEIHRALAAIGLEQGEAGRLLDPTSCPGAESCKIAITGSRELVQAVKKTLEEQAGNGGRELIAAAADLRVKVSGCPNSCGQHHIAGIGFHGAARNVGGRLVPVYQMFLGGSVDGDGAHFGARSVKIPARRVPEALTRLLALFRDERRPDETALAFFKRVAPERVETTLSDLVNVTQADLAPEDYQDLGEDRPFELTHQEGECAT